MRLAHKLITKQSSYRLIYILLQLRIARSFGNQLYNSNEFSVDKDIQICLKKSFRKYASKIYSRKKDLQKQKINHYFLQDIKLLEGEINKLSDYVSILILTIAGTNVWQFQVRNILRILSAKIPSCSFYVVLLKSALFSLERQRLHL